jgi:hypothetical protein
MTTELSRTLPGSTIAWLTSEVNPVVAVLTRRILLEEADSPALDALWARRNEYAPVAEILSHVAEDGSWDKPSQDYRKYTGSLWQIHFLGELHADGSDERIDRACGYAFSRQLPDGSWSCNGRTSASIPCLTANVGRAIARLGHSRDERVIAALRHCVELRAELGALDCRGGVGCHINGYCHMLTPKLLLFLAEVPHELWPEGADRLRDDCVAALRDKRVYRSLPTASREFQNAIYGVPAAEQRAFRDRFVAEHAPLIWGPKPGWLRFGYPLSYNSDVLEALWALALHGEPMRDEYSDALEVVRAAADTELRWTLRTTFNGRMLADVEIKGEPSRWLTLRALRVLGHFGVNHPAATHV